MWHFLDWFYDKQNSQEKAKEIFEELDLSGSISLSARSLRRGLRWPAVVAAEEQIFYRFLCHLEQRILSGFGQFLPFFLSDPLRLDGEMASSGLSTEADCTIQRHLRVLKPLQCRLGCMNVLVSSLRRALWIRFSSSLTSLYVAILPSFNSDQSLCL